MVKMVKRSSTLDNVSVRQSEGDTEEKEGVTLKREIGLVGCIAFVVGSVIGSGIFISPKGVLQNTGSVGLSLVVWGASGTLSGIGALCYAELGTFITKSGGDFTYILESFGPVPAFIRVWTLLIAVRTASNSILAATAATYLVGPFFGECSVPTVVIQLLGSTLIAAVFFCNSVSVAWSNRVQIIFSIAKVLGLVIIIVSGVVLMIQGNTNNLEDGFVPALEVPPSNIPLAFYSGLYAFGGWQDLTTFTEEVVNPSRNIPLGIVISMIIITGVYILANLAYFVVLTPLELLASDAVALTFSDRVMGSWSVVMSVVVALSCVGAINGASFSFARILLVASREGLMPQVLGMINVDYITPLPAIIATFPLIVIMMMVDVHTLINYISFSEWLFLSLAAAAIPYFRWKYPNMHRPFKVPILLPVIFIICSMFVVVVSIYSSPADVGVGALITITGVPVYLVFVWWQKKPQWFTGSVDSVTCFLQRFLLVSPEKMKL